MVNKRVNRLIFISQRMSSIISDIFYGSKQNLLDNYLINRFEKEQSLSIPQHKTAIYTSSLHFAIIIPLEKGQSEKHYQVGVQMGKRTDQVVVSLAGNNQAQEIVLALNQLDRLDLSMYSNIKITISEGMYKNKVFGYIPIETIKSLISQHGSEKTIVLPMKGRHFIGCTSIKCTIKIEFTPNNILGSNILASVDKDSSQLSQLNTKNRQKEIEDMSGIEQLSQKVIKMTKPVAKKFDKRQNYGRSSQQSIHLEPSSLNENMRLGSELSIKPKAATQYIRQITTVTIIFSSIQLNQQKIQQRSVKIKYNDSLLSLGQELPLTNITKNGVDVDVQIDECRIGQVHLNALFLTMHDFKGELPIYDQNQRFLGTVSVNSPSNFIPKNTVVWKKQQQKQDNIKKKEELETLKNWDGVRDFKSMLVLSIQKIIMTNTSNQLNNESVQQVESQKLDLFDFIKMQAYGRLELIIRINNQTYKFNDISIKYIIDCNQIQVVQFRRRQEFIIHSFHPSSGKNNTIEIELYSNHRLLCYSKSNFSQQITASHQFLAASTNFRFSQCGLYLKFIHLHAQEDYFHESRVKYLMDILQKMLRKEIKLVDLSDDCIKKIMNTNKKVAYVEVKKLFSLFQKNFDQIVAFQSTSLETVFGNELQKNEIIAKMNAKLLRQFVLIDVKSDSAVQKSQFGTILQFFAGEEIEQVTKEYQLLASHCIKTMENRVLYPMFVAGLYLSQQKSISQKQQNKPFQQLNETNRNKNQGAQQSVIKSQQFCFIEKIIFSNLHVLNLGKVPNIQLSIAKKVHYSNANPQFVIEKSINIMQPIKIYHKNIALNGLTLLAQFQPIRRRSLYQIDVSGKATAKVIWGN